jgi:hypothetical protein
MNDVVKPTNPTRKTSHLRLDLKLCLEILGFSIGPHYHEWHSKSKTICFICLLLISLVQVTWRPGDFKTPNSQTRSQIIINHLRMYQNSLNFAPGWWNLDTFGYLDKPFCAGHVGNVLTWSPRDIRSSGSTNDGCEPTHTMFHGSNMLRTHMWVGTGRSLRNFWWSSTPYYPG